MYKNKKYCQLRQKSMMSSTIWCGLLELCSDFRMCLVSNSSGSIITGKQALIVPNIQNLSTNMLLTKINGMSQRDSECYNVLYHGNF